METIEVVCPFCSGKKMHFHPIGSDIDPSGEEQQYVSVCLGCGGWRYETHRWNWEKKPDFEILYGKWKAKELSFYD